VNKFFDQLLGRYRYQKSWYCSHQ